MKSLFFVGLIFSLFTTTADAQRFGSTDQVLIIPSSVFSPANYAQNFRTSLGQGGAHFTPAVTFGVMTAPINLPVGARITGIRFHLYDNSAGYDVTAALYKEQVNGFDAQTIIEYSTSSSSTTLFTHNQRASVTIDDNWGYLIRVFSNYWEGDKLRVKGVRITYQMP